MPYGVFPAPETRDSNRSGPTDPSLAIRIRTHFRRADLDKALATGVDPGRGAELSLRGEQLSSPSERARIANVLVEALGDARSDDAGDLHDALRSALSALAATADPAEELQAQAA
jgi:hypothetical protein